MFHRFLFSPGRAARALTPGALLLFAFAATSRDAFAQFTFANIADNTMASPLGGTFSKTFQKPGLNDSGTVAFIVDSTGNRRGVYTGTPGGPITTIAANNTLGPGGATYSGFRQVFINAGGTVAFTAIVGAPLEYVSGDAVSPTDQVIAANGQGAPVSGGSLAIPVAVPVINSTGVGAFYSGIAGGSVSDGIFKSTPGATAGNVTKVALDGEAAPGAGGGVFNIGFSQSISPGINDEGIVAFQANITGGTATGGVFMGDGTKPLTAVMLTGQAAPSSGTFTGFTGPLSPRINNHGRVVFGANTTTGKNGLYSLGGGPGSSVIALNGQAAPDSGGGTFSGFDAPAINDSGVVAFYAALLGVPGSQGNAIYTGGPNGLNKVIQLGDSLFGSTLTNLQISTQTVALNNVGQVAFQYELADGRQGIALASPVGGAAAPEPASLALLTLVGLTVTGVRRRAAKRQAGS